MNNFIVLPILIPLVTAIFTSLFHPWKKLRALVHLLGSSVLLVVSICLLRLVSDDGIQATQIGGWVAPFGITLVADLLSAIMVALVGIIGFAVSIYSLVDIDHDYKEHFFYPLFHILLMGVCGAFLTGDLFNLYVWFEVILMASFALMTLGGEKKQLEGAIKYVTLSLISSILFLSAVGILYGITGSLNMADLALRLIHEVPTKLVIVIALLFLLSFGIKAAIFPLFFWLPASYHTTPVAVSAIFSGLLTQVGVYALIRTFTLLFVADIEFTHNILLIVAALTMITGILGALVQTELRRLLSFQIVSHVGYIIMGLGLLTHLGIAGAVYYLIHQVIIMTSLFLLSGVIYQKQGTFQLQNMGGLYKTAPFFAILFLIPALSLAGFPPFSGFFAKFALIKSAAELENYLIVFVVLVVSFLTLYSMAQVWTEAFWKKTPKVFSPEKLSKSRRSALYLPIALLAIITLSIGFYAEPVMKLSLRAADQLLNPTEYIQVVLGGET